MKNSTNMPPVRQFAAIPNGKGRAEFSREKGTNYDHTTMSFNNINVATEKKEATSNDCENKQLESKAPIDINESAEAFIKKFRQQLLIQRLDSIENYQKMLQRGL
ncbi:hypothetical protein PanWU01x14_219750 [Parasponia andersonii]|uniref:DUF761 domain-containing protein n=1 Tax=Parasponia andersonii TaxID=3476 RepID=A0A2P5BQG2_PARAD|nr:hypothetical protein PanWU01x14_219750 [Parasponia andersonii]